MSSSGKSVSLVSVFNARRRTPGFPYYRFIRRSDGEWWSSNNPIIQCVDVPHVHFDPAFLSCFLFFGVVKSRCLVEGNLWSAGKLFLVACITWPAKEGQAGPLLSLKRTFTSSKYLFSCFVLLFPHFYCTIGFTSKSSQAGQIFAWKPHFLVRNKWNLSPHRWQENIYSSSSVADDVLVLLTMILQPFY